MGQDRNGAAHRCLEAMHAHPITGGPRRGWFVGFVLAQLQPAMTAAREGQVGSLDPFEKVAGECSISFDRPEVGHKRDLAVRLVALGALHEADFGYIVQVVTKPETKCRIS
jgi:hypothetical protein